MTCFITGGTGRLGSALIAKLLGRQDIKVLDPRNSLLPEGVTAVKGDLNDLKALEKGMTGVDIVFHLATLLDYNAPWNRMEEVNVQGTRNVVEMCAKQKVRKLVFISSTAVYGKNLKESPADENTPTNPTDLYGKSKLEAERVVGEHFTDVPSTILRPGVLYGPTYLAYYSKVFNAIQKGKMSVLGDGKNVIPFVHADDVADAMIKASAYDISKGKTYVLSGNRTLTQERIYEISAQSLGVEFKKQYMNPAVAKALLSVSSIFSQSSITQEDINVLSSHRIFDTTRAETDLAWSPMPLEAGIKQMADLYMKRILEMKKKKYLEYQRDMQKQGKFVSIPETPVPGMEEKPQSHSQTLASKPTSFPAPSKPKYFQPMPKDNTEEEQSAREYTPILPQTPQARPQAKPAPQMPQAVRPQMTRTQTAVPAREIPKPAPQQKAKSEGSFFGFSIGPETKPEAKKNVDAKGIPPAETSQESYPSNATSRLAPEVSKPLPGRAPPKMPAHVLARLQELEKEDKRKAEMQQAQKEKQNSPNPVVGSGRSWVDNVLQSIKKESEQKKNDEDNK